MQLTSDDLRLLGAAPRPCTLSFRAYRWDGSSFWSEEVPELGVRHAVAGVVADVLRFTGDVEEGQMPHVATADCLASVRSNLFYGQSEIVLVVDAFRCERAAPPPS